MKNFTALLAILPLMFAMPASAQDAASPFSEAVKAAMSADSRPEADRERDGNRKPVETLAFFGITGDMSVLELIPGGGWYTRLLAPALAENGELYVGIGTGGLERSGLLEKPGFEGVTVLKPEGIKLGPSEQAGLYTMNEFDLGVSGLDAALTFRNVHNFDEPGRANMHAAVFDALAPGGIYGVVDHTRRHMQPDDPENGRRADPVLVIKEIQAAGFEFVDYSPLHYRPDDELRYEVGRKTVSGNTDRFTFLFKKPE